MFVLVSKMVITFTTLAFKGTRTDVSTVFFLCVLEQLLTRFMAVYSKGREGNRADGNGIYDTRS